MDHIKNILVPTDFSENANSASRYAIHLAELLDANLTFFHVNTILLPTSTPLRTRKEIVREEEENSMLQLKKTTESLFSELNITMREGKISYKVEVSEFVVPLIEEIASEYNIELIVIGNRGANKIKKFFFGSTTAKVIERVECTVLAIPEEFSYKGLHKVAYATDFLSVEEDMNKFIHFIKKTNVMLDIFHVYPTATDEIDVEDLNKEALLENLKKRFHYTKMHLYLVHTERANQIIEGIDSFVSQHQPDLVAMFSREKNFFEKLFGKDLVEEMTFSANVPLLIVK